MSTNDRSIAAYEDQARVASYDASMEIMHPNRHRMAAMMIEILSASEPEPRLVLDLGTGTGFLLERLLAYFPRMQAVAVDGAESMAALVRTRLGEAANRVDLRVCDFRSLADTCRDLVAVDAVVSTFALHHLTADEKAALMRTVFGLLSPGGWFLCGDLIVTENDYLEVLIQRMRVRGIVARAGGRDARFLGEPETRAFLARIEEEDNDQPQKLASDLSALEAAGFEHVMVFWRETREVLFGGVKMAGR
jgi:ubiquinone/menaquinone biosynthesis C-methylase UbiE